MSFHFSRQPYLDCPSSRRVRLFQQISIYLSIYLSICRSLARLREPPGRAATMSQVQLALWRPSWRSSLTCVLAMCLLVLSKDWNQGLARPSRATLAHEPSAVSLGDLEDPHVLRHALSESAASTGRFSRNVILMVTDFEHQHWAHNLLLNLHSLELHHSLVIASAPRVCSSLHKRLFATGVRVGGHCAHSSYLRETSNASIAAGLHRWQIDKGHVFHLWWQRWR